MALFTFEDIYIISFTDVTKGTITIPVNTFIDDAVDIVLVGKSKLDYGDRFDENILHLLENFAAPQDLSPPSPEIIQPDIAQVNDPVFDNPTDGQLWFNKTDKHLYVRNNNSNTWEVIKNRTDIQGNRGIIVNGQQIPLPDGFSSYDECSWFVSPQYIDKRANYIECYTDATAKLYAHYRSIDSGEVIDGVANYIIIGIKQSDNNFLAVTSTPTPSVPVNSPTVTRSVTPTPTPTINATRTPSPTVSNTPTNTITPSVTATPSVTKTITPTLTRTPTPTPITFQSFTINAELFPGNYPVIPETIGYHSSLEIGLINGTGIYIDRNTSIQYGISSITTYKPELGGTSVFEVAMQNTQTAVPFNAFNRIRFTDKDGIFRTFLIGDSTSSGFFTSFAFRRVWTWFNQPSTLFVAGQFIILFD